MKANLSGAYASDDIGLTGAFSLANLAPLDPALSGGVNGAFEMSGSPVAPAISGALDGEGVAIYRKALSGLRLELASDALPDVSVSLSANYDQSPLNADFQLVSGEGGGLKVETLTIVAPGSNIEGAVELGEDGVAVGSLNVQVSDFSKLGPILLQPDLTGSLAANVTLGNENGMQSVGLEASAPRIGMADLSMDEIRVTGSISDATGAMAMDTRLNARRILAGGEQLDGLSARLSGRDGQLPFTVAARLSNAPFNASGSVETGEGGNRVGLDQLAGAWKGIAFSLASPTRIDLASGAELMRPFRLRLDDGLLTVTGSAGDAMDLSLSLTGMPLSSLEKVAPSGESLSGRIDLGAKVSGPSSNPTASWQGQVTDISSQSLRGAGLPALSVATSGTYRKERVSMQNQITGGGADLTVGGNVALGSQSLTVNAEGSIPFSLAAQPLADAGLQLTGSASLSAKVTGPISQPIISGQLTTRGARFSELSSGLVLRDLSGAIQLADNRARIEGIQGRLGKEGILSINGTVGLDTIAGLPADISVGIKNGSFQHEDILTSSFDAQLRLSGALMQRSVISGRINLRTTEISIPETLPSSLSPVAVSHKNAQGRVAEQAQAFAPRQESGSGGGPAMVLDLDIVSPNRIYIRGRGIDAELGGQLRITGTTANPNPVGSTSMLRGRMDVLTKRLDFDRGTVTFAGTLDPSLDFSASSINGGTTFFIGVNGFASAPEISLSSSPSLPDDEILARLFFDRSLSSLSPLQLAQLANAVATLSGANSGPGVLDRLRTLAGIDNIDVKTDEETNETTVGVGRYLNDRTYINVERGTSSDKGKVSIDLEITDQIKAYGEADTEGRSKAGIFFERDY